jgi:hypothetical protein
MIMTSPRNRGWLWYLLIVGGLAVVAVTILIAFNVGQQLKWDDVQAARRAWQQHGPRSYRLAYTSSVAESGQPKVVDHFVIHVRDGKTSAATRNGKEVPSEELDRYGMERLFDLVEANLREDAEARVFTRAKFDDDDGHLVWYVRSPRGKARLEITVESLGR